MDAQQGRQGGGKPERARQCQDRGCAAWVLCERWHECRGGPPQPPPRLPGSPGHPLQLLPPSSVPCLSITFPRKLTHIPTCCCFLPLPCPPRRGPGCSCLTPCLPPLSPLFSLLSLPLPADRVRQVRPVLRAPGPPSTSNQFPPLPRRPPFPSPPGHLFCDFMVAPQPQSLPFICDFLWCGELTPPGVTLVKICAPLRSCSCPVL